MTGRGAEPGADEPPGGAPGAAGRPAAGWRSAVPLTRLVVVLAVILVVFVVAVTVAVVAAPPSEDDLLKQAGMTGKRELLVGVKDDQPGVAMLDRTGRYTGFDIDIAYMIASDLGFRPSEVRFLSLESEDRERMQAVDPRSGENVTVDIVVASFSITRKRIDEGVNFSAPYLVTEQSVVTRKDHRDVEALSDLAGEKVCTIGTSTSAIKLEQAGIKDVQGPKKISTCMERLTRHECDAVTTDAAILAGFTHARQFRGLLKHHDIALEAQESWGVNVGSNKALQTLVNLSLYRSWHDPGDRRWEDAYDRNLRVEQPDSPHQQVAVETQPEPDRPAVRRWPWQS
jgi:glutamate transport system substrate-binding protein